MKLFDRINLLNQIGGEKTSFVLWSARLLRNTIRKAIPAILRAGYSGRTVAAYFRKQGAQIGEHCDIQVKMLGTEPYLVSIGNHVFISEGVVFHTHDGGVWVLRDKIPDIRVHGPIIIEDNCIIGANTMLMPNIRIGRNSIVGAGSVVISDIPPNSIVMGVPARVISSMAKYEEKCTTRWKEQKPPDLFTEENREWWYSKKKRQKIRKHLTNLFMNQDKSGEEAEK